MTLPDERYRAVLWARAFLRTLLCPSETPRVPKKIREQAYWILKHFPDEYHLKEAAKKAPDILDPDSK